MVVYLLGGWREVSWSAQGALRDGLDLENMEGGVNPHGGRELESYCRGVDDFGDGKGQMKWGAIFLAVSFK